MGSLDKEIVYKFMVTANRPFSSNDVFSSLQQQGVGKSAVDKALDQLVKENKIVMKVNGKQKIYCVVQQDSVAEDQKEIQLIDGELLKTTETVRNVELKYKQSDMEVKALQETRSTEDIERKKAEMKKIVAELKVQVTQLSQNASNIVSGEDREQVMKDFERVAREYRRRKRMCTDILDSILENYPKSKKDLFEEIGVETDESVDMPNL